MAGPCAGMEGLGLFPLPWGRTLLADTAGRTQLQLVARDPSCQKPESSLLGSSTVARAPDSTGDHDSLARWWPAADTLRKVTFLRLELGRTRVP